MTDHNDMFFPELDPAGIERKSFEIIRSEAGDRIPDDERGPVITRVVHTTADFEYLDTLRFSDGAVRAGMDAIRNGAWIITDTNMALAGINKKSLSRWGGQARCYMADESVAERARKLGKTRASVSVDEVARLSCPVIYAVGNAPTALLRLHELIREGSFRPRLVIGVPVGFVNVVHAKECIMQTDVPYIVAQGRKGGSTVAACIINALLYMLDGSREDI